MVTTSLLLTNIKARQESIYTPNMETVQEDLLEAIEKGNTLEILKLLEINVDPTGKDSEGNTILHHILSNEKLPEKMVTKILEIFLDDGIDPNTENSQGETALHLAVVKRMHDAIDLLIKYNATINADGRSFITHYFVEDEYKKFWKISDNDERTIAEFQTATFVDWLISRGFDFHLRNHREEEYARDATSAFNLAEEFFLMHIVTAVLENTKDLEFDSYNIYYQERKLFDGNIFVDGSWRLDSEPEKSWYDDYRLRHATNIVKILLAMDDSIKARYPILELALSSSELSVVEILTNNFPEGCDERRLATIMFYCLMRHLNIFSYSPREMKMMKDLLDRGVDVNGKDFCGRVPLYWAVDVKNLPVVQFLKDRGADFHTVDNANWNMLHTLAGRDVCRHGFHDLVEKILDLLVSEGVQMEATNKRGRTPLQLALEDASWTAAGGLIFHGAEVDGITGDGRKFCDLCLQEIGVLKDTFVDGRTSLYRLLRMHPNERYIYANNEILLKIIDAPNLKVQFPKYSRRILLGYNEAKERHSLVERAKKAWWKLTETDLPDECIERIFVYLSDKDLNAIINS